ncbi:Uncharacterised protein [Mycobacteroides abscessus subsp. abscessus]|nr:Uncharacterised protein [Mycobacteroides abscessus subsp. abscessus]
MKSIRNLLNLKRKLYMWLNRLHGSKLIFSVVLKRGVFYINSSNISTFKPVMTIF